MRRPEMSETEGRLLAELVRSLVGMTFDRERTFLLAGRLAPQLAETECETFFDYYQRVKYEGGLLAQGLIDAVVNNETYFFRELAHFDAIADLAESREHLRILCAACSSGEEPYSLAMVLDDRRVLDRCDITGIDISSRALDRARRGVYGQHSFRGVEGRYLDTHFSPEGSALRLASRYRDAVRFERANLLESPEAAAGGGFDVVMCRNALIYFDAAHKRVVIDNLIRRMAPGGLLFLGHSESLFGIRDDMRVVRPGGCLAYQAPGVVPACADSPVAGYVAAARRA